MFGRLSTLVLRYLSTNSFTVIFFHIFIFCTTKGSPLWTAFCIIYAIYFLLQNYYLIRFYLLQFTPVSFLLLIIIMNIFVFDRLYKLSKVIILGNFVALYMHYLILPMLKYLMNGSLNNNPLSSFANMYPPFLFH